MASKGYSSIRAQGLSAPPYLGSFFILLASTYMSDKFADPRGVKM
jgi:hypothetical protein